MQLRSSTASIVLLTLFSSCSVPGGEPTQPDAGPATRMIAQAGNGQTGLFGQPVAIAPAVLVTDANNQPVSGVAVAFALGSTEGSLTGTARTTSAFGVATVGSWTLGNTFGTKTLIATAAGLPSVTFTVSARAPDAGTIAFILVDPAGDTIANTGPASTPKGIDLLSARGEYKRDSLILTLNFSAPVEAFAQNAASSIAGFVEIDIDDNVGTGAQAASNVFGASATLGVDYAILMQSPDPGFVALLSFVTQTSVMVPVSFSDNSMIVHAPMSTLGNDDGNFSFAGVVGTIDRATDVFPNASQTTVRR